MHINLTNNTPVAYRPYKLSHQEKLIVRDIVCDLLEKGIIRESNSEYASPIILVKKKDGSDRMCVDYRALNKLTSRERYPLPLIDDHIDRLGHFKFFSSLDMATGFHQIPIDWASIHKTAFVTPEGHYEYLRMPYGLTNSPIVYQRIINKTLRSHIDAGYVLVYVDDVLIMSNTVEEGIVRLRDVLKTLTDAGFSINLGKCSFLATKVEYLGRVVSQGQVGPSPRKVEALVNAPIPSNDVGELKRTFTEAVSLFGAPKLLITDRGRMFESAEFIRFLTDIGCDIHHITPEMHHANGQVERYARTVLNMIRIEANHKGASWSEQLWRLQLVLNMTKQKTTQHSALNLLVGIDAVTPVLRSLIRDVAIDNSQQTPRDAWRELCRARANDLLKKNQAQQDTTVNRQRRPPRKFNIDDLVFVIKYSQSTGKLDPGMRGPYRVLKALPSDRYELKLLSGSYGKTTQAAAEYLVPWRGEWCPETCAAFFEYPVPVPEAKFEDASQRSCNETDDSEAGSSASQGEAQASGPSSVPGPAQTPQEVVEDDS
ncbi:unnamed protein product [Plutella xylostella]|uniref:(diamondback moth) hypothetical protein n=1 Tax=Plutella xylostella TaxID=51655 RepID=A0A8S4GA76_PLUXY|nr:unnamed protein product [Plutella xylostella]